MRSEKEIMDMLIDIAENDERIRAVFMNGSRTNRNAPKDIFQDHDVVYVVRETQSFIKDREWADRFGEILFMQYPDEHPLYTNDHENQYGWLMQFADGNRIDLTVQTVEFAKENILTDSLCEIVLDKDGCLPEIDESSDRTHWVKKPDEKLFACECNEFWWCLGNVAKGLWRKEVTYALDMLNFIVRKQLEKMLGWKVGVLTDWSVSAGKSGKYLHRWLEKDEWERYISTYCGADIGEIWSAVFEMCDMFYEVSSWVAQRLGYDFNKVEAENCMKYLKAVRDLPENAVTIM